MMFVIQLINGLNVLMKLILPVICKSISTCKLNLTFNWWLFYIWLIIWNLLHCYIWKSIQTYFNSISCWHLLHSYIVILSFYIPIDYWTQNLIHTLVIGSLHNWTAGSGENMLVLISFGSTFDNKLVFQWWVVEHLCGSIQQCLNRWMDTLVHGKRKNWTEAERNWMLTNWLQFDCSLMK